MSDCSISADLLKPVTDIMLVTLLSRVVLSKNRTPYLYIIGCQITGADPGFLDKGSN